MIALSILRASISLLVGVLIVMSPGRPRPYLDEEGRPLKGSISEKTFVNINGVEQGMFIKGRNASNPILLYLHGDIADYFLTNSGGRAITSAEAMR
jgi:hypothetical protein